jgi:hypothetical protein
MDHVRLDFGNMMAPLLARGVEPEALTGELAAAFTRAHGAVESARSAFWTYRMRRRRWAR